MPVSPGRAVKRKTQNHDRRPFRICRNCKVARTPRAVMVAHAGDSLARHHLHTAVRRGDRDPQTCARSSRRLRRKHHPRRLHALPSRRTGDLCSIRSDVRSALGQTLRHRAGLRLLLPLAARSHRAPPRHAHPACQRRQSSPARIWLMAIQNQRPSLWNLLW